MSIPTTREAFKQFCLRKLGAPVIEINVDDDQVEDRIDEALSYYSDYHFDATEKIYFKHKLTANNWPDKIYHVMVHTGGDGNTSHKYANGETLVFTGGGGSGGAGTITTDANGQIVSANLTDYGDNYAINPTVTVDTVNGQGGVLEAELGGFIELPDNIIGAVSIFDISGTIISQDMFSIQYQIALNDIWSLSSYSMIPYYTTLNHMELIRQLLTGSQPIRYQRHRDRLQIDMLWDRMNVGNYIVGECYQKIDPNAFPDVWNDWWLQQYCTALIKQQWGNHLKKFKEQRLPGGVVFSGQEIYDEAHEEIMKLEKEMINTYSIPNAIFIG